jgi:hypothetical protein
MGPRRRLAGALVLLLAVVAVPAATASEWGTIQPGTSTMETVRARFGAASKTSTQKLEGHDAAQWIYEGAAAPPGFVRLAVDFGLLTSLGYRADIVRDFTLAPKPGVFNRRTVVNGWGVPNRIGREGDIEVFLYVDGLLVYFDKEGWNAQLLVFTPRQPLTDEPAKPRP